MLSAPLSLESRPLVWPYLSTSGGGGRVSNAPYLRMANENSGRFSRALLGDILARISRAGAYNGRLVNDRPDKRKAADGSRSSSRYLPVGAS